MQHNIILTSKCMGKSNDKDTNVMLNYAPKKVEFHCLKKRRLWEIGNRIILRNWTITIIPDIKD